MTWQDLETQTFQKLVKNLFKVHSWLTYRWKSAWFSWYFHTFHENAEGVIFNSRVPTTAKTICEVVLFKYVLTNTKKKLEFNYFTTKLIVFLRIMDMDLAKFDGHGWKEKVCSVYILLSCDKNPLNIFFFKNV